VDEINLGLCPVMGIGHSIHGLITGSYIYLNKEKQHIVESAADAPFSKMKLVC
jgi:hypothetical protein